MWFFFRLLRFSAAPEIYLTSSCFCLLMPFKPSYKKTRRPFISNELLLVFSLAVIILFFSLPAKLSGRDAAAPGPPSAADVSARLSASLGPDATIVSLEYLPEANLSSLAKSQPVIYGNITAPVYRATVNEGGKSFLILYDFGSGMVLRRFEVIGVQLD